ncbi:MAG: hypothetical protein Ct9H300mP8_09690 [Gammaproteobacteria bacterium]|nr:MAG: hypothetical protein Ct9H300mP8_09690 [Gammaproteobacteria bacterium]
MRRFGRWRDRKPKKRQIPGVRINLPSITPKDREDVTFGLELDVDFIAQSFVRSREDIAEMRELLNDRNHGIHIFAKIENREGATNIASIAEMADGLMVARGDLGLRPTLPRCLICSVSWFGRRSTLGVDASLPRTCWSQGFENPIPTRAEVTDVANAIYEGVDAVMLSAETSIGDYPVKAVEQLAEIAMASERFPRPGFAQDLGPPYRKTEHCSFGARARRKNSGLGYCRHYASRNYCRVSLRIAVQRTYRFLLSQI